MKRMILVACCVSVLCGTAFSQSFTLVKNDAITGNNGVCLGFDSANGKVIRSSFGNPPTISVLNKDTLASEGQLATGGVTWGTLGAFGIGVGPDGSIVAMDHVETNEFLNGLIRWTDYTDATPEACTALSSVPFPRYIDILGTGTDQVLLASSRLEGGPMAFLTTANGTDFAIDFSIGDPDLTPPERGGQRGCAMYVGTGTAQAPQYLIGCDNHSGTQQNGIHVHRRSGSTYIYQGEMNPTSPESSIGIQSIAIDPGFPPTESQDGEDPVLIALGAHTSADHKTAFYMFNLRTLTEVAVLPFTPASAEMGYYGAIDVDAENNRVYFSIRNVGNSSLGYADYAPPTRELVLGAKHWDLYD